MAAPILLATRNAHKLAEVRAILEPLGLAVEGLDAWPDLPEAPEPADTFEGNARAKARWVHARTGRWCVADDSGLEVAALGWGPGVRSKRFTPEATAEANNARLLREMEGVADRRARFRCVIAVVGPRGEALAEGIVAGRIAEAPSGEGGFGYDPLFLPDEAPGRTMAELTMAEKNRISHRGRAFRRLPELLARVGLA